LPLNPQSFGPVAPDLAFNTALSFITNANWQAYSGEQTMSHFTQMAVLTDAQFPRHRSSHGAGYRADARHRA
jgi:K+-transporting ATPase ATPase A chain